MAYGCCRWSKENISHQKLNTLQVLVQSAAPGIYDLEEEPSLQENLEDNDADISWSLQPRNWVRVHRALLRISVGYERDANQALEQSIGRTVIL